MSCIMSALCEKKLEKLWSASNLLSPRVILVIQYFVFERRQWFYAKEYKDNKVSAISCLYSIAGRSGGRHAVAVPPHSGYVTCTRA
jgi:hypothetical protein